MKKILCLAFSLAFFASCRNGFYSRPSAIPSDEWMKKEIDALASSMTLREKASQVLMTGIDGKEYFGRHLYAHFRGIVPGTVILFRNNVADTPEGIARYIESCDGAFESLGSKVPVLFAIDHEGGDVVRTRGITSPLPSARSIAEKATEIEAERLYELSGRQLLPLGIGMNVAPVCETETEANAAFLGTRSYSADPGVTVRYAGSAVRGYRKAGVLTVLKHFPGNGNGDPHTGLPRLDVSRSELLESYTGTFRSLLGEAPDAVLVSHIVVPAIDGVPFCLSHDGVTGLLRNSLGFDGVVMTDDISMGALADNGYSSGDAAVGALKAGCDMIMTSSPDIGSIVNALIDAAADPVFATRLDESVRRILAMKARTGLVKTSLERYSISRYGVSRVRKPYSGFDANLFYESRKKAGLLLEEIDDE